MKKEHCVLILICCFLMAACGRLEDIPEDLSAFPETERKETAETPAGPQFETLTVADDPITAEFSLTTRQEPAATPPWRMPSPSRTAVPAYPTDKCCAMPESTIPTGF